MRFSAMPNAEKGKALVWGVAGSAETRVFKDAIILMIVMNAIDTKGHGKDLKVGFGGNESLSVIFSTEVNIILIA